jgi:hypothetical protein
VKTLISGKYSRGWGWEETRSQTIVMGAMKKICPMCKEKTEQRSYSNP